MATTIKVSRRGAILLPAKLRRQLNWVDGTELTVVAEGGEVRLQTAVAMPVDDRPVLTLEETAYYMMMSARTREDWDAMTPRVAELGIDVAQVPSLDSNRREMLPTREQWEAGEGRRRASRLEELHRS